MRRREFTLALAGAAAGVCAPALRRSAGAAEMTSIRIVKQYGLPYLPLMVMEHEKLVEKHAAELGLGALEITWATLGGPSAMVDGLLGGQLQLGVTATPALATLWDKTAGTAQEVRALSAVQSQPYILTTRDPAVHSIADFGDQDRIAVPSVKISGQALALEMAAAKLWGFDQFEKLDPLTVTLPHPDAVAALLSGKSEVNSHYTVTPFYYYELAAPGIRAVLKSYDTFGGKHVNGVLLTTKRFFDENPNTCTAVFAAQEEANAFIKAHPRDAAEIYLSLSGDKHDPLDKLTEMVADPDNDWTTIPAKSMEFVDFMHKVGRLKRVPDSWKDLFLPPTQELAGS
jgi:NitT/TauT family transport system substrate-binding protein